MKTNILLASAVAIAMSLANAAVFAGANDYTFEPTAAEPMATRSMPTAGW